MARTVDRHDGPCPTCGCLAVRVDDQCIECPTCRHVNHV